MVATNNAFISYRRESGYAWAKLVWEALDERGVDVFLDLESLRGAGTFDVKILNQIAGRPYFVLVLTKGSLERCVNEGDWLCREIDHAVETERVIVPMIVAPFSFDEAGEFLPAEAAGALRGSNGIQVVPDYFDAAIERLIDDRLVPTEVAVDDLTDDDHAFAGEAVARAKELDDSSADLRRAILGDATRDDGRVDVGSASIPDELFTPAAVSEPAAPPDDGDVASPTIAPDPALTPEAPALTPEAPAAPAPDPSPRAVPAPAATTAEAPPSPAASPPSPRRLGDRRVVIGVAIALLLALVVAGLVLVLSSGDDGPTDQLRSGSRLDSGEQIETSDQRHVLEMTENGELIAHTEGEVWWRPGGRTVPGSVAEMQSDGNFVVYPSKDDQDGSTALWHASTHGNPGAFLRIGDDDGRGVIEIVRPDGGVIWRHSENPSITLEPEQTPMTDTG
jgi:hypothetical protein